MKNCIVTYQRNDAGRLTAQWVDSENPSGFAHKFFHYATAAERIDILNELDTILRAQHFVLTGAGNDLAGQQRFYTLQEPDNG